MHVSIIILNLNGLPYILQCLDSVAKLSGPRADREVLVIDNGSTDGSLSVIAKTFPWARIIPLGKNTGFSFAANHGASLATGDILVFLNNDIRVTATWLTELIAPIEQGRADATSAKMFMMDGKRLNFGGAGMNIHGIGFQQGFEQPDGPAFSKEKDILFACGGAMAVTRDVFKKCKGFDQRFFAYYEDVDLGWRMWLLGYTVRYVPAAVCFHHHSATSAKVSVAKLRVLHIRNPLYMLVKNIGKEHFSPFVLFALLVSLERTRLLSTIDRSSFDILCRDFKQAPWWRRLLRGRKERMEVDALSLSDTVAYTDLARELPELLAERAWIQQQRKRPDTAVFALLKQPFWMVEADPHYHTVFQTLRRFLRLDDYLPGGGHEA